MWKEKRKKEKKIHNKNTLEFTISWKILLYGMTPPGVLVKYFDCFLQISWWRAFRGKSSKILKNTSKNWDLSD